jgi:predicted nucleic acid-binding protein
VFLLDTNVVSEFRKVRPHGGVLAWLKSVGERTTHISAVTLGEIQYGIEITRLQDARKASEMQEWLDSLPQEWNVLPMDGATFRIWGKLMHQKSRVLTEDAMIAATALQHDLTLATRNVKDFRDFGVKLLDPFTAH